MADPTTTSRPASSTRQLLRWMFQFLRPVKWTAARACLFLALWTGAEILAVRQTAESITRIERVRVAPGAEAQGFFDWLRGSNSEAVGLERAVVLLALLSVAMAVLTYFREVSRTQLSMQKVFYIREAIYDRLQRVALRFHDRISTGELINRALSDLQHVREFVNTSLLVTLEILLIVGGYVIVLLTRSPWVALLAMAPLPLWVWYFIRFSRRVQPAQKAVMEAGDRNIALITENIAGVHVVRAFATEQQEIARYNANCESFFQRVRARIALFANFIPVMRGISMSSHLSLFLLAGVLMVYGRLDPGDILLLGSAMSAILGRLQQAATINEQYQNAIVSARRLQEVLSEPTEGAPAEPEPRAAAARPPLPIGGPGAVRFENVTFGYDAQKPVLSNVSFDVPGGKMVAIVGPTGSGKSTLAQLVARFYDPQIGRVLIDGADVRDVALESLRTQVAFVFQDTYLFSDTVEANIAYGRPAPVATDGLSAGRSAGGDGAVPTRAAAGQPAASAVSGQIEAAARLAQAHDFVDELPRGYATPLGERGASLSGGQRQRLAIARAIFANPRILILDDATASVDPETEELIHGGTRFVMTDRTTFVIAHRLNTVKRADLVIVLEHGRVTQIGSHDELMQADGHYRDIARMQLHADEDFDADGELPSHLARNREEQRMLDIQTTAAAAPATAAPAPGSSEETSE